MLEGEALDAVAPVLGMVDVTIKGLSRKKFAGHPIVAPVYSAITSIVSSAYKRHGKIIEEALAATLRRASHLTVWSEPQLAVSDAADRLADSDASLAAALPYTDALLHAAGLHLRPPASALELGNSLAQLGDRVLQDGILRQQPLGQGLQLTA